MDTVTSFPETVVSLPKAVSAASCSEANKEARLEERKVCFISEVGNLGFGGGWVDSCPKADIIFH